MSDRLYLFVYGTLRSGEPGHELMSRATFVCTAMVRNLKKINHAEYPACVETFDGSSIVEGEIWDVPVTDLELLNEYEGENYTLAQLHGSNLHAYLLKERDADRFVKTR